MTTYPKLSRSLLFMCNDQGGMEPLKLEQVDWGDETFDLDRVEAALAALSDEELDIITIGDREEWPPIFDKLGDNAELVHEVLDYIFETVLG